VISVFKRIQCVCDQCFQVYSVCLSGKGTLNTRVTFVDITIACS